MGRRERTRLPRGFAGTVRHLRELAPAGERVLRLPAQGVPDGPFLRLPDGPFDAVVVERLTESMGDLRRAFAALSARMPPGGGILADLANLQGPAALHRTLEGRPGSFDPVGSLHEPERAVLLRAALEALDAAGFLVQDVHRVPASADALRAEFARNLMEEGFLAAACVTGPPPARLWVTARRQPPCAGSALVGAGAAAEQERTARALRAFLPEDWEVLTCSGDGELESFNRGVARSSGELLWFLRAGSVPDAELFRSLLASSHAGPAVPRAAEAIPGGFCGLLIPRLAMLLVGPLPRRWQCEQVAYEDFGLRLSATARNPVTVDGRFACPAAPEAPADLLEREAAELMELWEPIAARPFRGERTPETSARAGRVPPWQGRQPRVSLCMIARDEEQYLEECLRRAAPAVDEIVLVDTGSTDRTVEIAESFGARVLHEPWTDDFAAARNPGIEAATGDWILVLDADERLTDGAAEEIRTLASDAGVSGYHVVMRNVYEGGVTQGVRMVRLFRKLPGVRFENRLHEQVTPSLAAAAAEHDLVLSSSDLAIEHVGYQDHVVQARRKDERNERIFRRDLAERPDDVYTLYKFGDFLRRLPGRGAESLAMLERALELVLERPPHEVGGLPYAGEIAALCALEHAREDRIAEAEDVIERAFCRVMPTPNLHYIAAGLALRAGRNDEAIAHFRRCLGHAEQVLVVPIQEGITGHVSLTGIAQAYLQKGEVDRARRLLEQSRALCPSYDVTALTLSRLHFEREQFSESVQVLTDYLAQHPDSAGVCQQATLILSRLGLVEQARAMGSRAIALLEQASLNREADKMRETVAAMA